jgi:hypothetical protein
MKSKTIPWQAASVIIGTVVASSIAFYYGVMQYVWANDAFYLATAAFVFMLFSLAMSIVDRRWAVRGETVCPAIGLLGNVVGISYLIAASAGTGPDAAWAVFHGVAFTCQATAVGIVGLIVCYFQAEALA